MIFTYKLIHNNLHNSFLVKVNVPPSQTQRPVLAATIGGSSLTGIILILTKNGSLSLPPSVIATSFIESEDSSEPSLAYWKSRFLSKITYVT